MMMRMSELGKRLGDALAVFRALLESQAPALQRIEAPRGPVHAHDRAQGRYS